MVNISVYRQIAESLEAKNSLPNTSLPEEPKKAKNFALSLLRNLEDTQVEQVSDFLHFQKFHQWIFVHLRRFYLLLPNKVTKAQDIGLEILNQWKTIRKEKETKIQFASLHAMQKNIIKPDPQDELGNNQIAMNINRGSIECYKELFEQSEKVSEHTEEIKEKTTPQPTELRLKERKKEITFLLETTFGISSKHVLSQCLTHSLSWISANELQEKKGILTYQGPTRIATKIEAMIEFSADPEKVKRVCEATSKCVKQIPFPPGLGWLKKSILKAVSGIDQIDFHNICDFLNQQVRNNFTVRLEKGTTFSFDPKKEQILFSKPLSFRWGEELLFEVSGLSKSGKTSVFHVSPEGKSGVAGSSEVFPLAEFYKNNFKKVFKAFWKETAQQLPKELTFLKSFGGPCSQIACSVAKPFLKDPIDASDLGKMFAVCFNPDLEKILFPTLEWHRELFEQPEKVSEHTEEIKEKTTPQPTELRLKERKKEITLLLETTFGISSEHVLSRCLTHSLSRISANELQEKKGSLTYQGPTRMATKIEAMIKFSADPEKVKRVREATSKCVEQIPFLPGFGWLKKSILKAINEMDQQNVHDICNFLNRQVRENFTIRLEKGTKLSFDPEKEQILFSKPLSFRWGEELLFEVSGLSKSGKTSVFHVSPEGKSGVAGSSEVFPLVELYKNSFKKVFKALWKETAQQLPKELTFLKSFGGLCAQIACSVTKPFLKDPIDASDLGKMFSVCFNPILEVASV